MPNEDVTPALAVRGMAHDLNNLLALVLGHAEMALAAATPGSTLRSALEQITHAADLGAELTGELLRSNRWAEGRGASWRSGLGAGAQMKPPASFPTLVGGLNWVVLNALDIFRPLLPPSIVTQQLFDSALWPVAGDAVALEEAVINLVDNAREAMPHGGTLTVSTANVAVGSQGWPGAREARQGDWVRVSVADTGTGMDEATLGRIFEPDFTTKKRGTGLGLPNVQRIVRGHGGWLAVTSEKGKGSSFSLFLPPVCPCLRGALPAWEPLAAPRRRRLHAQGVHEPMGAIEGRKRILVVDDEPSVRGMLRGFFEARGYDARAAAATVHLPGWRTARNLRSGENRPRRSEQCHACSGGDPARGMTG